MEHFARDQYGITHFLGKYPRKELLEYHRHQYANKMYRDTPTGEEHIGWVIAGHWYHVWRISELEG